MKKLTFLFFACLLILGNAYAQKGNTSIMVCGDVTEDENGSDNVMGIFTGYNASAVGKDKKFIVYVRFQDFPVDVSHTYELKLIAPSGENIMNPKKGAFILGNRVFTEISKNNWTVSFPTTGLYQIQLFVNDKLTDYLNINVGK